MSTRAVIGHETWTLQPDREPDAEPTTYATESPRPAGAGDGRYRRDRGGCASAGHRSSRRVGTCPR
ncbi:DUF7848 domain-containing protein [Streptomyces violaceusniger]